MSGVLPTSCHASRGCDDLSQFTVMLTISLYSRTEPVLCLPKHRNFEPVRIAFAHLATQIPLRCLTYPHPYLVEGSTLSLPAPEVYGGLGLKFQLADRSHRSLKPE